MGRLVSVIGPDTPVVRCICRGVCVIGEVPVVTLYSPFLPCPLVKGAQGNRLPDTYIDFVVILVQKQQPVTCDSRICLCFSRLQFEPLASGAHCITRAVVVINRIQKDSETIAMSRAVCAEFICVSRAVVIDPEQGCLIAIIIGQNKSIIMTSVQTDVLAC